MPGPILPLQRRCWRDFSSVLAGLATPSSFFPFLPCSAIFCYAGLCFVFVLLCFQSKSKQRLEWNWPFRLAGTAVECNRFRCTTLPVLPLPCLTRLVTTQTDASTAGNPARRDTKPTPGLGTALPWQHDASSSFFFALVSGLLFAIFMAPLIRLLFLPLFFPVGAEPVSPLLGSPNLSLVRLVGHLPPANSPSLL